MLTTLVVGATGATGQLLVKQLLDRGMNIRAIVRSPGKLSEDLRNHNHLNVIQASTLDLPQSSLAQLVTGCNAVASCLGHNLTLKGIYGRPRMLVTDTVRRLCETIKATHSGQRVKFVLMNTAGNSNRDVSEKTSVPEKCALGLIRLLIPPHRDNEAAADYLRTAIGQCDDAVEWAVVRPDTLLNQSDISPYDVYPSPIRSAIFSPGKTSRINVAHFMADLITDDGLWDKWTGQMPVVYNKA